MRRLGEIRNWVHLLATIAAMPVSVAQSPLELIGNTPVCGELLISPESAIRHTHAVTRIMRRVRFSSWAFRLLPKLVPIRRL
jgi:hypothetical protein